MLSGVDLVGQGQLLQRRLGRRGNALGRNTVLQLGQLLVFEAEQFLHLLQTRLQIVYPRTDHLRLLAGGLRILTRGDQARFEIGRGRRLGGVIARAGLAFAVRTRRRNAQLVGVGLRSGGVFRGHLGLAGSLYGLSGLRALITLSQPGFLLFAKGLTGLLTTELLNLRRRGHAQDLSFTQSIDVAADERLRVCLKQRHHHLLNADAARPHLLGNAPCGIVGPDRTILGARRTGHRGITHGCGDGRLGLWWRDCGTCRGGRWRYLGCATHRGRRRI